MTESHSSLLQYVDVRRGPGEAVHDILRGEPGFLVDIGFSDTAREGLVLATRVSPLPDFLMTGGAVPPVSDKVLAKIRAELVQRFAPAPIDFARLTPPRSTGLTTPWPAPAWRRASPGGSPTKTRRGEEPVGGCRKASPRRGV
jgi:hypothetical protein